MDVLAGNAISVAWTEEGQILSPRQKRWQDLLEVSPDLHRLIRRTVNEPRPPDELSDMLFVALVVTFSNPTKREILRAQILDLMTPDLTDLLKAFLFKEDDT